MFMFYVFVCYGFWIQAERSYVTQGKMHPKWGRGEPGRRTIHYFARSRFRNMMWHTTEPLKLTSVNEEEATWARLSALNSVLGFWTLHPWFNLRTMPFIYIKYWASRKDSLWGKKLAVYSVCKLQFYNTHQTHCLNEF